MKKCFALLIFTFISFFLMSCEKHYVRISFDSDGGTAIETISVEKNHIVDLPIPSKEGYTFQGWFYESRYANRYDGRTDRHIKLYALFERNEYQLTIHAFDQVFVTKHLYASDVMMPFLQDHDQVLTGWYQDEDYFIPSDVYFMMPSQDVTIYGKSEDKKTYIETQMKRVYEGASALLSENKYQVKTYANMMDIMIGIGDEGYHFSIRDEISLHMIFISKTYQKNYAMKPDTSCQIAENFDDGLVLNHSSYLNLMHMANYLKDMSKFEFQDDDLILKESYRLDFSNYFLKIESDEVYLDQMKVTVDVDLLMYAHFTASFVDVRDQTKSEYYFGSIGMYDMSFFEPNLCN